MALRFVDSFDHYSAAQMSRKWSSVTNPVISAAGGRRGTSGLDVRNLSVYGLTLDNQSTWTIGFSLKFTAASLFGTSILAMFIDGATAQCDLRMTTSQQLQVTRNGTVLATTAGAVILAGEQFVEFKTVINNATGTYEVRVNGVNVLSATGQNTRTTANNFANTLSINGTGINAGGVIFDDMYLCDGTGAINNTFLGDVRVDAVLPAGAGANTGMTPSAGSNFQCVDENPATDDTDYVASSVVATKDTYDFTNITHNPTAIMGVQHNLTARKDDAGARSIAAVTRSGGADTDGATQALSTTYVDYRQIVELDPNGAIAWTKANLNAAEFGSKVAA